jgi:glycosyltransferase involved in cell wall biosynthesis
MNRVTNTDFYVFGADDADFVDPFGLRKVVVGGRAGKAPNADAFSARMARLVSDYDVVHFHTVNKMAMAGAVLARLRRRPALLTPLGGGGRTGIGPLHLDGLFAGFPVISQYSKIECPWVHRRPSTVIYGGGDAAGFGEPPVRARQDDRITCVGRISAHKGVDVLIRALPAGAELVVCGQILDQEYASHLQHLARGKRVEFVAAADDDVVSELYATSAAVVLNSLHEDFRGAKHRHPELLGLVLLEAMAHSTPVVGSRVGGVPEIVEHGVNGFLVDPGDVGDLEGTLSRLLEDSSLRSRMGSAGRRMVDERFTWASVAERVLAFYDSLFGTGTRAVPVGHRPGSQA